MNYVFHWKNGTKETSEGDNVAQAFSKLGYSAGALEALDWWEAKDPKSKPLQDQTLEGLYSK